MYLLYTISRVAFILLNYNILKPISTGEMLRILGGGLMFDNTAILYTNSLFLLMALLPVPFVFNALYQKAVKWVYVIFNFITPSINALRIGAVHIKRLSPFPARTSIKGRNRRLPLPD